MRKHFLLICSILVAFICISWGTTGHFAVGLIAEHHLTPKAKEMVQDLLGSESLANTSTWADDVRGQPEYKQTGSWHYINVPVGLDYQAFEQKVKTMSEDNLYKAVLKCREDLLRSTASQEEKKEALKFLVHFIGDLHQPMHVSRAENKGGNTIQVNYKQDGTNLHAVWDSKLIEDQRLSYKKLADKCDNASPEQIKQWQSDDLMKWLWESYQISGDIYKEIESMKIRSLKNAYYKEHIQTVDERVEMAGIRLAGFLNEIANSSNYVSPAKENIQSVEAPTQIKVEEVAQHVGQSARVCSKIYGHKDLSDLTLVNLGAEYPNHLMTVVLKGDAREIYKKLDGKKVCVMGKIIDYKGKPEIIVTNPKDFELKP